MKTFFLFAFSLLFATHVLVAQTTQVINSNIRAELQFYEFWTDANGDDNPNQDDAVVQLDLTMSPSGLTANDACVTWQCNAPCTYASDLNYLFTDISFDERLDVLMLAYESDNNDLCTNYSDDDFYWIGNAVMVNDGRITDTREATWDQYNGGGGVDPLYLFPNSPHFDAKLRIAWRYIAGETIDDPLQFGSLTPAQDVSYFGTNLPNPAGQNSVQNMGWQDNGGNASPDVFFSFSLDYTAEVVISTDYDYTDYDSYIALYDSDGTEIASDDDGGTNGSGNKAKLTTTLAPGNYRFKVEGYQNYYGQFQLTIHTTVIAPANDQPCAAILIPADGSVQSGFSNVGATVDTGEGVLTPLDFDCINGWCGADMIDNSVWFRFQAPASGAVEVSTCNMAGFDTQIAAYSAGDCGDYDSYTLLAANDDASGCNLTSRMNVGGITPGQTYYILVDGYEGQDGSFSIQVTPIMASAAHEAVAGSSLLTAYPNPTSGLLTVRLDGQLSMQACTLSDLTGKTVAERRWTQPVQQTELDLGALPAGLYFLQVRSGERVLTEKIMVQ